MPHLTYCGDATIGEGANIGAGTIFANYDGVTKDHTDVGAHSFVGSNSVIVAPRTIGDGAYVAAGSAVVSDVAPGQLAVDRGPSSATSTAGSPAAAPARRPDAAAAAPPSRPATADHRRRRSAQA